MGGQKGQAREPLTEFGSDWTEVWPTALDGALIRTCTGRFGHQQLTEKRPKESNSDFP